MLTSLFAHLAWADAEAHAALQRMPQDTPTYARALAVYAHLAAAEHIWLARLEGRTPAHPVWPALPLASAHDLARESAAGLAALTARHREAELGRQVTYRNSAGEAFVNTVGDILLHVALHGSYHRGQLALLAREGGGPPASTDYIVFLRRAPVSSVSSV